MLLSKMGIDSDFVFLCLYLALNMLLFVKYFLFLMRIFCLFALPVHIGTVHCTVFHSRN